MIFSSLVFLFVFLPIVCLLYYSVKNLHLKNLILLVASLFFYAWGEPVYVYLMIFSIVCAYFFALLIHLFDKFSKFLKNVVFVCSLICCLFFLFYFKYQSFFLENINALFHSDIPYKELMLPIGISFYTFQILSYLIDVYNKKVRVQTNLLALGTYVALFPQLIAGPIVRYETVHNELKSRETTLEDVSHGLRRFILGLGKKVIISNQMALIADTIFNGALSETGTLLVWIATLAYTFQIYFDFSGYSDMAIGLGRMFGFHFLENFNYPYVASSITDFWRRWHISLSSWFRDYVYIPLGGNRVKQRKWIRNILIVWLLTGLWHGASWNFVLWGLYFGGLLIFEKLFFHKVLSKLPKFFGWIYTMFLVMMGWVLFRVENLNDLLVTFKQLFIYQPSAFQADFLFNSDLVFASLFMVIAIVASLPLFHSVYFKNMEKDEPIIQCLYDAYVLIVFVMSVMMLVSNSYNPFIYFRF